MTHRWPCLVAGNTQIGESSARETAWARVGVANQFVNRRNAQVLAAPRPTLTSASVLHYHPLYDLLSKSVDLLDDGQPPPVVSRDLEGPAIRAEHDIPEHISAQYHHTPVK